MVYTTGYTFTPCVGYFTSPCIDTSWKGPAAFIVSSERHWQSGVKKIDKRSQWDSNLRPLDRQSRALTTEAPCPKVMHAIVWCCER